MATRTSAGLLVFRGHPARTEVLLGHMGGPLWARKDAHAWSIPKGEPGPGEPPRDTAYREFTEELGIAPPDGVAVELGSARQSGGKVVTVFAIEGDVDPNLVTPGTFTMEWPRGSGEFREFPEIDRAGWFVLEQAREKLVRGQQTFLDRLSECREL